MTMCRSVVLSNRCTSVVIAAAVPGSRYLVANMTHNKFDAHSYEYSVAVHLPVAMRLSQGWACLAQENYSCIYR